MRRNWVAGLAVAALVWPACAGCQDDPPPGTLPVTTLPPSATTGGPATAPTSGPPAPTATSASVPPPAGGPLMAYRSLAGDWRRSRSRFFAAVSDGRRRTPAQQHALAAAYLAGLRRFAAGLRTGSWPASAGPVVRGLLAANARQQTRLVAMTRTPGPSAFAARLADYGVDAALENRAVAAVERVLGG